MAYHFQTDPGDVFNVPEPNPIEEDSLQELINLEPQLEKEESTKLAFLRENQRLKSLYEAYMR